MNTHNTYDQEILANSLRTGKSNDFLMLAKSAVSSEKKDSLVFSRSVDDFLATLASEWTAKNDVISVNDLNIAITRIQMATYKDNTVNEAEVLQVVGNLHSLINQAYRKSIQANTRSKTSDLLK